MTIKEFFLNRQQAKTGLLLAMAIAMLISIFRDAQNSMAQPYDMRNRITGSRIMKDGGSPYFYIWQLGDTVRYYDIHVSPKAIVSLSTATPFFHAVTAFFADFPQHKHNVFWFCIEYFLLGSIYTLTFLSLPPPDRWKGYLIASVAALFTYTVGWRIHVNAGQMYLLIPLLAMICYYCLLQKRDLLHLLLFSVAAAALMLIRPISPLLFIPFLFYPKKYFIPLAGTGILIGLYAAFAFFSPLQKQNWRDYFRSVQLNVKIHQHAYDNLLPHVFNEEPIHTYEEIDLTTQGSLYWNTELRKGSEIGNFYVIYEGIFHKRISVVMMTLAGLVVCTLLLFPLLLMKKKGLPVSLETLLLIGFLIYNTYEFFNPTIRAIYHWVQFLFPLMLLIICLRKMLVIPLVLLLVGIYLNIVVWPEVKMEHIIGEMLFVLAALFIAYRPLVLQYVNEDQWQIGKNVWFL